MGRDDLKIEGDELPPYALYETYLDGSIGPLVERFATIQEARLYKRSLDKRYALMKRRKRLPDDWPTVDY